MEKIINKYVITLLGVIAMLVSFTSCTDQEDIDISYEASSGVSAAHIFDLYSPFESGDFDLSLNNWTLHIDFLVYDDGGSLKMKEHYETTSLSEVFHPSVSLAPGRYRVISIASFTKNDNGTVFSYWNIENTDNLTSLSITENSSYIPVAFETLGIDTQEIVITDKPVSISADIKPVTSLVTVFMDDRQYLHYGEAGRYSAKCRMVAQYNIRSLSSNSTVRFNVDGTMDYQTKEQSSEYNTAISRPHDKLDEHSAPTGICYRALLPEKNKEFQWQIYNREDELTDLGNILVGAYPTEGRSNKILNLESGKQYALMMILDATELLFEETGKDAFNYEDYVKTYMTGYELGLIDDMLDYGYNLMLGWSESQFNTYLSMNPYDHNDTGTIAYYPHSAANHFEQFVTIRYNDASRTSANRIMLSLSVPSTAAGTTIEQPLSQEIINALVEKLNAKYTVYSHIGDVYQWIDKPTVTESKCGITLDVSKPGNANLYYDLIAQSNEPGDSEAKLELIFQHEWESFLGKTGTEATSILGPNFEFDTDTWVYSPYNEMLTAVAVSAFYGETISNVMVMVKEPNEEINNFINEHLRSKFVETSPGHYADSKDILSQTLMISYSNGMISYMSF